MLRQIGFDYIKKIKMKTVFLEVKLSFFFLVTTGNGYFMQNMELINGMLYPYTRKFLWIFLRYQDGILFFYLDSFVKNTSHSLYQFFTSKLKIKYTSKF